MRPLGRATDVLAARPATHVPGWPIALEHRAPALVAGPETILSPPWLANRKVGSRSSWRGLPLLPR